MPIGQTKDLQAAGNSAAIVKKPDSIPFSAQQIAGMSIKNANWNGTKQTIALDGGATITWNAAQKRGAIRVNDVAVEELPKEQREALAGVLEKARLAQGRTLIAFVLKPVEGLPANYHLQIERYLANGEWSDLSDYPQKGRGPGRT